MVQALSTDEILLKYYNDPVSVRSRASAEAKHLKPDALGEVVVAGCWWRTALEGNGRYVLRRSANDLSASKHKRSHGRGLPKAQDTDICSRLMMIMSFGI